MISTVAFFGFVTDYECMSDLTACSVGTCYDLAVNDDSAADTSSESDHDHILRTCRCTFPCFTECCYVCIVSCLSLKNPSPPASTISPPSRR